MTTLLKYVIAIFIFTITIIIIIIIIIITIIIINRSIDSFQFKRVIRFEGVLRPSNPALSV